MAQTFVPKQPEKINWSPVEKKIEDMLKDWLKTNHHVKTGSLLNSISVKQTGESFEVSALDYFYYLDEQYNITEAVFGSKELADFIENFLAAEMEKQIDLQFLNQQKT